MSRIRAFAITVQDLFRGKVSGISVFTVSFLITIVLFGLFFTVLRPDFDTLDDATLMLIASGVSSGAPCEYLPYTNILIGLAVQFLYNHIPGVNWYPFYLFAAHFIAMLIIIFSALRIRFSLPVIIHLIFLWIVCEVPLLMNLQFTSTAFVAALGGCCSLLTSLTLHGRTSWYCAAVSVLLFLFAGLIRYEVLYCVFLLLAPLAAVRFFERKTAVIPVVVAASLILFFVSMQFNTYYYSKDPSWKEYFGYNEIRARLHNQPELEYTGRNTPVFQQIGWSENDFRVFKSWFFFDHTVYSREKLAYLDQNLTNERTARETMNILLRAMLPASVFLGLSALYWIVSWILTAGEKRKYVFCILLPATAVCLYLAYTAHLPRFRVFVPIVVWVNFMIFFLILDSQDRAWKSMPLMQKIVASAAMGFAVVILLPMLFSMIQKWDVSNREETTAREKIFRLLSPGEKKLYIVWNGSTLRLGYTPLFSDLNELKKVRLVFSGWTIYSPFQEKILAAEGIDNVYLSFGGTTPVYLVMNRDEDRREILKKFVSEHYRQKIEFMLVDGYQTMGIYKTRITD